VYSQPISLISCVSKVEETGGGWLVVVGRVASKSVSPVETGTAYPVGYY